MVTTAGATTINFDALVPVVSATNQLNGFPGIEPPTVNAGPFRMGQVASLVDWNLESGIGGNSTNAIFNHMATTNIFQNLTTNMMTYIPALGLPGKHDAEFTFKGVDIYHDNAAFLQINILGNEGPDAGPNVFALGIGIPPGTGWFHYDLDTMNIPINTNNPPEFAHNAPIGALVFNFGHVTTTPGFTVGFDNLRVCQQIAQPCSYDAPILFTSFTPTTPLVPPVVPQTNVPEPSTWIYLFLAVGMVMGFRKYAHV
jgi:hypothetical protein